MFDLGLLAPEKLRRFKRSEYEELVRRDVFEGERVELLHGTIVTMSPPSPEHDGAITNLTMLLVPGLVGRAIVRVQLSLLAVDDSVPQPDLAIVPLGSYAHERPSRAYLLIEVAGSSLRKDRALKAPLYAASGVEEYWIVNVAERRIETFLDPNQGSYRNTSHYGLGQTLSPRAFADVTVHVADVFA